MYLLDSKSRVLNHKVRIKVFQSGSSDPVTLEAVHGQNLRQVLLGEGITPYQGAKKIFNCRGMGICGTCKILVLDKNEWWDRRSCQIQCFQNLEIQLK